MGPRFMEMGYFGDLNKKKISGKGGGGGGHAPGMRKGQGRLTGPADLSSDNFHCFQVVRLCVRAGYLPEYYNMDWCWIMCAPLHTRTMFLFTILLVRFFLLNRHSSPPFLAHTPGHLHVPRPAVLDLSTLPLADIACSSSVV